MKELVSCKTGPSSSTLPKNASYDDAVGNARKKKKISESVVRALRANFADWIDIPQRTDVQ